MTERLRSTASMSCLTDLDGVIYTGVSRFRTPSKASTPRPRSARIGYITNNASRTPESVAEHLTGLGLTVAATTS